MTITTNKNESELNWDVNGLDKYAQRLYCETNVYYDMTCINTHSLFKGVFFMKDFI